MEKMDPFSIQPIELTSDNAILPQPHQESVDLLVYAKNPWFMRIEYYVNISGGLIIMGFDEKKVLRDIEFNIRRNKWEEDDRLEVPTQYSTAGLEFPNILERSNELDLPIITRTNQSRSIAFFTWGEKQSGSSGVWYALSSQCFAFVPGRKFVGCLVELT